MAINAGNSSSWFDTATNKPVIDEQARRLESFVAAMADGRIEASELQAQEQRLVALMREIEPQLSPELHERVTQLLCELTSYDVMQVLHTFQEARPKTAFRG
ncbi:MAG TPA: hypothetical protein VHZ24_13245 [Pirellulales bacterium]|jgi:hypothetical protein|nr:hypothetical protein [Pirellulales bacterium]